MCELIYHTQQVGLFLVLVGLFVVLDIPYSAALGSAARCSEVSIVPWATFILRPAFFWA